MEPDRRPMEDDLREDREGELIVGVDLEANRNAVKCSQRERLC